MTEFKMLIPVSQGDAHHTRWFNVVEAELPVRLGVYEGTAWGVPDVNDYVFEHQFYYWDGQRFYGLGRMPAEAALGLSKTLPVAHWRGLRARSAEKFVPSLASDLVTQLQIRVEHIAVEGSHARFRFATVGPDSRTADGEAVRNPLGWFQSPRLKIKPANSPTVIGLSLLFRLDVDGRQSAVYGVWKQEDENEDDKISSVALSSNCQAGPFAIRVSG